MQKTKSKNTSRAVGQRVSTSTPTSKKNPGAPAKNVRHLQRTEAWQIQAVTQYSARASWYIAIIRTLTGQTITVTQEGRKRSLSVGPFSGDSPVMGIEVGIDETLKKEDPLEKGLEILCNRICKAAQARVLVITFDEVWREQGRGSRRTA